MSRSHRETIFQEQAEILDQHVYPDDQYILRVNAPDCARHAKPGQFAHLQCDPSLPMRRPLSIMRVNSRQGWVEFLYKIVGKGTALLARRSIGESISMLGPIGQPFQYHESRPRALLMGGGVGIPPMVFLAEQLKSVNNSKPLVLMGSEVPFPFSSQPSKILVPGMPYEVIAAMPLMEDWGIPSRLASRQNYPGCYEGYITDLARSWLNTLEAGQLQETSIYACGPHAMLAATAAMAREYDLPCQVSLEEYMACAVGGCAGCVVETLTETGTVMKRVCVDGPVFPAEAVFPARKESRQAD